MKHILFFLLSIISISSFSQTRKGQLIGSVNTPVIVRGSLIVDSGMAISQRDTVNHPLKDSAGALTFWKNILWIRNKENNKWQSASGLDTLSLATPTSIGGIKTSDDLYLDSDGKAKINITVLSRKTLAEIRALPSSDKSTYIDSDRGGGIWVYNALNDGIDDDGTRLINNRIRVYSGDINSEWFGVKTTLADNAVPLKNAITVASAAGKAVILQNGVFLSSRINFISNFHLKGQDSSRTILKMVAGSSSRIFSTPENVLIKNIKIENLKIDGGVRFANHHFDPINSTVSDTNNLLIGLGNADRISFNRVAFTGSERGIGMYQTYNFLMEDCSMTGLGGPGINTDYWQNIENVTIRRNYFDFFGMRDKLDGVFVNKYRFGECAIVSGGSNWIIEDNYFGNGSQTKWAWMEGRFTRDVFVRRNVFDGKGKNSFGLTIIGNGQIGKLGEIPGNGGWRMKNMVFEDNVSINMPLETSASDSINGVAKYMFNGFNEFQSIDSFLIARNVMPNFTMQIQNMTNGKIIDNDFTGTGTTPEPYESIIRFNGVGPNSAAPYDDTVSNVIVSGNRLRIQSGVQHAIHFKQGTINDVYINHNTFDGVDNFIPFGALKPLSPSTNRRNNIHIENNTFLRPAFAPIVFTDSTFTNLYVRNNDFIKTGTSKNNILYNYNIGTSIYNGNTIFKSGNTYIDGIDTTLSFDQNGSDLNLSFNGAKAVLTIPSASGTSRGVLTSDKFTEFNNKVSSQWFSDDGNLRWYSYDRAVQVPRITNVYNSNIVPVYRVGVSMHFGGSNNTDNNSPINAEIQDVSSAVIGGFVFSAVNPVTYTNTSSLAIFPPFAGTNVTLLNPYTFRVYSGKSNFGGDVEVTGKGIFSDSILLLGSDSAASRKFVREYLASRSSQWLNVSGDNISYGADGIGNNIGIGTISPNTTAKVDISSTTKGILIPRMSTAERNAIVNPAISLFIYNTSTGQYNFYTGTKWAGLIDESTVLPEYADNAAAITAGLTNGQYYRTGDFVKQVHP